MDGNEYHRAKMAVTEKMTAMAAEHADTIYRKDGTPVFDRDSDKLFALLTDAAFAYCASLELETEDPDPGQALFVKSGMSEMDAMITGLEENLTEETMKPEDPFALPVNGWTLWRMGDGPEDSGESASGSTE